MAKHFVITGVSQGLGRQLALRLVELGHLVSGCARNHKQLHKLQQELGLDQLLTRVDVADAAAVEAWAQQVLERGPAVDVLINNAAVMNRSAPLWTLSAQEFDLLVDVNIKGVANVIRAFVPAMIQNGSGVVVNMSSTWGRVTAPNVAPYCCSKWGIEGLSKAMAQELPPGMAVVALNPGIIHTAMLETCFGEQQAKAFPEPEAWVDSAVELLLQLDASDNGASLSC